MPCRVRRRLSMRSCAPSASAGAPGGAPPASRPSSLLLVKKIAGELLSPLSLILVLLAVALVLLWFTRRQRLGELSAAARLPLLVVLPVGWVGGPAPPAPASAAEPPGGPPPSTHWIV